jgi:rhodanese-related sulfurtransferase
MRLPVWYSPLPVVIFLLSLLQISCSGGMFEDLSARDLKTKMDNGTKMFIVDLRTPREYAEGHVPEAVNIAPNKLHFLRQALPQDKTMLIVFYCKGYG